MKTTQINPEDIKENFWGNTYVISFHNGGSYEVNASNGQDALDILIDYFTEKKWEGFFLTDDEIEEEKFLEEYIQGGNEGRYLSFGYYEINIETI